MVILRLSLVGVIASTVLSLGVGMAERASQPPGRERFDKLFADGDFKDAFEGYRRLALDPTTEANRIGTDLGQAIQCLAQLGRQVEIDAFREAVITVHQENWRLLEAAALSYLNYEQHSGVIVAGKFRRGVLGRGDQRVRGRIGRQRLLRRREARPTRRNLAE